MANVIKKKKRIPSKIPYVIAGISCLAFILEADFHSLWSLISIVLWPYIFYKVSKCIFRGRVVEYEEKIEYEDMSVDEIVKTGNLYLDSFEKKRRKIQNYDVRVDVRNIVHTSNQILEEVRKDPSDVNKIRKFITYYLPTIDRVLDSYIEMENVKETDQIVESKKKIEELMKTVNEAFVSLYDSLYENDTLDLMSEMAVLEKVIAQEGLVDKR
ncbi:MAG: 5-bromo-4-chloroindolyl phosphate hydrolysis family protein [Erysipelotrichaceae bacterium]|uniref:5-bromo-4-chloroindolyl phosphate hydrolysis family protein n=1 Tax=Floccifex sp. TaxID=2815810 RepID=UPI002A747886|nr:5-bromo-4-chloroindolyl phosphate hydrolysis family protein [Floccifex sp.]MDD7281671.1 5-bromo-4-chloroindolyl phosphate hydrolysis family protein [Erysipelotrichaceae bacterium]MDY2957919.1 5-bromo-4-chloroindolyl phosphate hydrolysis family protein [Floccifex sp.]